MAALLPMILIVSHVALVANRAPDQVPNFDTAPTCRADLTSQDACRRDEQAARRKLQREWRQFTRAQRSSCTQLSDLGGLPSYVELLTCLEMAKQARALPQDEPPNGRVGR
jgi:hypothetical protein